MEDEEREVLKDPGKKSTEGLVLVREVRENEEWLTLI